VTTLTVAGHAVEERLLDVEGARVQVYAAGKGQPVTLFASPTGTLPGHPIAQFALGASRLIAINPRGAGRSSPLEPSMGPIHQLAVDADCVRQQFGIERWIVAGQSRGGWFALEYALRCPDAVAGLILSDTSPTWRSLTDPDSIYNNRREDFEEIQEVRRRAFAPSATIDDLKRWMAITHHKRDVIEELALQRFEARSAAGGTPGEVPELLAAMLDEVITRRPNGSRWDVTERLSTIDAPTLVIHGRFDNIFPPRWGELIAESIPRAELLLLDTGHFAFDEEPDQFRDAMLRFLNDCSEKGVD
jgi:proline iminopeptidase